MRIALFSSSHVESLAAVENELFSVVDDEVNGCGSEHLVGLFRKSRIFKYILD